MAERPEGDSWEEASDERFATIVPGPPPPPPFLLTTLLSRLRWWKPAKGRVHWEEVFVSLVARALVGLLIGAVNSFLLVPLVHWPGRRGAPSLYDQWKQPDWIEWVFIGPLIFWTLVFLARTRVVLRP